MIINKLIKMKTTLHGYGVINEKLVFQNLLALSCYSPLLDI